MKYYIFITFIAMTYLVVGCGPLGQNYPDETVLFNHKLSVKTNFTVTRGQPIPTKPCSQPGEFSRHAKLADITNSIYHLHLTIDDKILPLSPLYSLNVGPMRGTVTFHDAALLDNRKDVLYTFTSDGYVFAGTVSLKKGENAIATDRRQKIYRLNMGAGPAIKKISIREETQKGIQLYFADIYFISKPYYGTNPLPIVAARQNLSGEIRLSDAISRRYERSLPSE